MRRCAAAVAAAAVSVALATAPAWGQPAPPAASDDTLLDDAMEHQARGHPAQADALLRQGAERGHVAAMERLALLHWYGDTLHPGTRWSRETARLWFARAAERGSELGRHMSDVIARPRAAAQRRVPPTSAAEPHNDGSRFAYDSCGCTE
jgi:TPR repeat protein